MKLTLKWHKRIAFKTLMVLIMVISYSCATFSELPSIRNSRNIEGIYFNDNPADSSWNSRTLWSLIDYKSEVKGDSLLVKLSFTEDNMLIACLMINDKLLVEKKVKGKLKDDGCYYSRRQFFIIPILPILWGYSNYQKRIYSLEDAIGIEITSNSGGVAIIMAGGNKYNDSYKFIKVDN